MLLQPLMLASFLAASAVLGSTAVYGKMLSSVARSAPPDAIAQSVAPAVGADWTAAPLGAGEYAHFTRHTSSDSDDVLFASIKACDCQPGAVMDAVTTALQKAATVSVQRTTATVCGRSAQHLVVTGFADGAARKNLDVYAFRTTDSLVVITLAFAAAMPTPGDETSMQALCPQSVTKPTSQPA